MLDDPALPVRDAARAALVRLSRGNDFGPPANATVARPSALLASSTAPIAAMRAADLDRREPSTRPVVPVSPVRV